MSRRGRFAHLLDSGLPTRRGVLADGTTVRCFGDGDGASKDFACSRLTVSPALQRLFAEAFAKRTAPGSTLRSMEAIGDAFRSMLRFSTYLASLSRPPASRSGLLPRHIDGFATHLRVGGHRGTLRKDVQAVKSILRQLDSWDRLMVAKLAEAHPPAFTTGRGHQSYSRAEFLRIATAARDDLRRASRRIRDNRVLLQQYRSGAVQDDLTRRLELLDYVERHADVPRRGGEYPSKADLPVRWVKEGNFGATKDIIRWAHLAPMEISAGAILLAILTGQNPYTIMKCTAAHHRADAAGSGVQTAIIEARKPRRQGRAHMDIAFTAIPDWISVPDESAALSSRDELHTAFGVYMLLHELTASSRRVTGSSRLMLAYCANGPEGRGIRAQGAAGGWVHPWSLHHGLRQDSAPDTATRLLDVSLVRLRMTYLELHQKPVAHTEQTLVNDYLGRSRGNLADYQRVVAAALDEQVATARALPLIESLSASDIAQEQRDPAALASRLALSHSTVRRMLQGRLDTVMNACIDNDHGPHSEPGQPCRASFMLCLSCPCARALPRHLPTQILVFERLAERRNAMTPLTWTTRFALPHAQLADLLARHDDTELDAARAATTPEHHDLVARFLNRELDLR